MKVSAQEWDARALAGGIRWLAPVMSSSTPTLAKCLTCGFECLRDPSLVARGFGCRECQRLAQIRKRQECVHVGEDGVPCGAPVANRNMCFSHYMRQLHAGTVYTAKRDVRLGWPPRDVLCALHSHTSTVFQSGMSAVGRPPCSTPAIPAVSRLITGAATTGLLVCPAAGIRPNTAALYLIRNDIWVKSRQGVG